MTYSKHQACSWHLFFVFGKSQVRNSPGDYTVLEGLCDILHISTKIIELLLNKTRLSLPSAQLLIYITQSFRSLTHTLIKGRLVQVKNQPVTSKFYYLHSTICFHPAAVRKRTVCSQSHALSYMRRMSHTWARILAQSQRSKAHQTAVEIKTAREHFTGCTVSQPTGTRLNEGTGSLSSYSLLCLTHHTQLWF